MSAAACLSPLVRHYVPTFVDRGAALAGALSPLVNAVNVATVTRKSPTTTFGVWVDAGSRYEKDDGSASGASALLQRVIQNDPRVKKAFSDAGATLTATQGRQFSGLYGTAMNDDVSALVEALGQALQSPQITNDTVNAVRAQLLTDKETYSNDALNCVVDHMHDGSYMGYGLSFTPLGEEEGIMGTTADQVADFYKENYVGARTALVSVGQQDPSKVYEMAQKHLEKLPAGAVPGLYTRFTPNTQAERNFHVPEAHICVGFRVNGSKSEYTVPLMVMQRILGQYTNDQQLATSNALGRFMCTHKWGEHYKTVFKHYHDTGLWGLYAKGMPGVHQNRILYYLTDELNRIVRVIDPEEFERAVAQTKTDVLQRFASAEQVAVEAAESALSFGELRGPEWYFSIIDQLTKEDMNRLGRFFFDDADPVHVHMGSVWETDNHFRARSYHTWWRD